MTSLRSLIGRREVDESPNGLDRAVELIDISKHYHAGRRSIAALDQLTLTVARGEYVSIVGASGSGKSTLLNIISGIDTADSGTATVLGKRLEDMSQDQLAVWRGRNVGIVFQFFQLMPTLTVRENVVLPMDLAGSNAGKWERADELLSMVGLSGLADNLPSELSGGEQQRAAIARALANRPGLLIADEPTGNLDSANGFAVIEIIERLWQSGTTVLMVTHDREIAARAGRRISMHDGAILADSAIVQTAVAGRLDQAHADAR